jgi:hypothetical protein
MSGQRHALAALYPRGNNSLYQMDRRLGGASELVCTRRLEEKFFVPTGDQTPVVKSVVRYYTD